MRGVEQVGGRASARRGGAARPPASRPAVKYHYSYRFFTYPVRREGEPRGGLSLLALSGRRVPAATRSGDSGRWGVWLGRYTCQSV